MHAEIQRAAGRVKMAGGRGRISMAASCGRRALGGGGAGGGAQAVPALPIHGRTQAAAAARKVVLPRRGGQGTPHGMARRARLGRV